MIYKKRYNYSTAGLRRMHCDQRNIKKKKCNFVDWTQQKNALWPVKHQKRNVTLWKSKSCMVKLWTLYTCGFVYGWCNYIIFQLACTFFSSIFRIAKQAFDLFFVCAQKNKNKKIFWTKRAVTRELLGSLNRLWYQNVVSKSITQQHNIPCFIIHTLYGTWDSSLTYTGFDISSIWTQWFTL